ncbi:PHP domain-containing protein [Halovenus rubra]|uniref:PHP domain-containing protein n=2 Tax=Halovenus rubra TaxID=869890 RepID=A0ACC7E025_9EURY|nr:PHP domain-containing protein [Halovenus rubra]
MTVADLHVHTTNSDGTLTLATLPGAARRAGVETVAVTDHDRLHPALDQPVTMHDGIEVIHGIELRVDTGEFRVDLLGYGVEQTEEIRTLVNHLQTDRIERAREIVDRVEAETGVTLDVTFEEGVGRPHIARAIEDSNAPYDYKSAFEQLIADGRPCYVPRDIPDFERGRDILKDACGIVGLAHPFRYSDPPAALELVETLDAVERYYPYGHEVDESLLGETVSRYDALVTGGSDAHEKELGLAGLDDEEFDRLSAHI